MKKSILLALLCVTVPLTVKGQWYGSAILPLGDGYASDVVGTTLTSLYQDYRVNGALLTSRAAQELINNEIHEKVVDVTEEYSDQALAVDKYLHALDIIDLLWNATETGFHAKDVYDDIKQTVREYKELLTKYKNLVLNNPSVHPSVADLSLVEIARSAAEDVLDECADIWRSYRNLALYIVPVPLPGSDSIHISICRIKPTQLNEFLENINDSMDAIAARLRTAYRVTRSYFYARFGYFNEEVHIAYTRHQRDSIRHRIDSMALERWKAVPDTVIARQNRQKQKNSNR